MLFVLRNSLPLVLALGLVAGCVSSAPGATMAQLQRRAWLDSGCRPDQLVLLHVDTRTKALEGCGRRLIYVESCEHIRGEYSCTWELDSASTAPTPWTGAVGVSAPASATGAYGQPTQTGGYPTASPYPTARPGRSPVKDVIPPPRQPNPLPSEYLPKQL